MLSLPYVNIVIALLTAGLVGALITAAVLRAQLADNRVLATRIARWEARMRELYLRRPAPLSGRVAGRAAVHPPRRRRGAGVTKKAAASAKAATGAKVATDTKGADTKGASAKEAGAKEAGAKEAGAKGAGAKVAASAKARAGAADRTRRPHDYAGAHRRRPA